jgi:outer membrane protein assembly factor BamB
LVRYRTVALSITSLLAISSLVGIFAAPLSASAATPAATDTGANWPYANHDLSGTNSNPQTLLGPGNVNTLTMSWIMPFGPTDPTWKQAPGAQWSVEPGSGTPPLIVDGIVYIATNQDVVYALNAKDGSQVWSQAITLNYANAVKNVPIIERQVGSGLLSPCSSTACNSNDTFWCSGLPCASPVMHKHAINYWSANGKGIINVVGFACELWGFDAITGDVLYHITNICVNVPGNGNGAYAATYASDPPEYYNGMLVYVMGGYTSMGGRSFLVAYNFTQVLSAGGKGCDGSYQAAGCPPLWQTFISPPSAGDPQWDYANCNIGWVFDYPAFAKNGTMAVPCTKIPDAVKQINGGDWGFPKAVTGSISTSWGQYAIDNKTGIVYFGTGEAGPFQYFDPKIRPGLNLYASTEMAVDLHTGKILWWFQFNPHDHSDFDASWSSIIGTTNGTQAIFKASKDGILFSLDAATGKPNWVFDNPAVKWAPGLRPGDPTSVADMTTPYPNYPNATWIQAPALAGALEMDLAYDGHQIYGAWFNSSPNVMAVNPQTQYANTLRTLSWPDNVTLTAIDANTGKVAWTHFFNGFVFRGGMTVTNGMLIMPGGDGNIYFLSTKDGSTLYTLHIGAPLFVDPTIGTTADGQLELLQIIGGGRWLAVGQAGGGATVPGAIMAFTLGGAPGSGGGSSTATSTTVVAVASNLPLNYIAYGAVTFAIVATVANFLLNGRNRKKAK